MCQTQFDFIICIWSWSHYDVILLECLCMNHLFLLFIFVFVLWVWFYNKCIYLWWNKWKICSTCTVCCPIFGSITYDCCQCSLKRRPHRQLVNCFKSNVRVTAMSTASKRQLVAFDLLLGWKGRSHVQCLGVHWLLQHAQQLRMLCASCKYHRDPSDRMFLRYSSPFLISKLWHTRVLQKHELQGTISTRI